MFSKAKAIARTPRLQNETIKVFTGLLGKDGYVEFYLALTGLAMLAYLTIAPVRQTYLRYYHTGESLGTARSTGILVLRWFSVTIALVAVLCAGLTRPTDTLRGSELKKACWELEM